MADGSTEWRTPAWAAWTGGLVAAAMLSGVIAFEEGLTFFLLVAEAVAFLLVVLFGGVGRWRLFVCLTPLSWLLALAVVGGSLPWLSSVEHAGALFAGCHLPRLIACTTPLRPDEPASRPPAAHLLGLVAIGLALGGVYAWLLGSGWIDAWDVDALRQTIYQPAAEPWVWGLTGGLGSAGAALFAGAYGQLGPGRRRRWLLLTLPLALTQLAAWAVGLAAAVWGENAATEGSFEAATLAWCVATAAVLLAWALSTRLRTPATA